MTTLFEASRELEHLKTTVSAPDGALVELFLKRLSDWKEDDSCAETLVNDLQEILDGIWFSNHERHATVALILAKLQDTVEAVGGMTMNERLATFDLLDRWDRSFVDQRTPLYQKVLAVR